MAHVISIMGCPCMLMSELTVNLLVCHFVCLFVHSFLHTLNHSFTLGIKGIKNLALTDPPCFQRYPSLLRTCKCQEIQVMELIFLSPGK